MMESLLERAMSESEAGERARYAISEGKVSARYKLISLCQMSRTHTSHTSQ